MINFKVLLVCMTVVCMLGAGTFCFQKIHILIFVILIIICQQLSLLFQMVL